MIESLGRLSEYLGMPVMASNHGLEIDYMNGLVHWLMLVLFIGWGIFFIYTLIKFRSSKNPEANYLGVTSHANSYVEYGVIIIEAFLLIAFAIPIWANVKTNVPEVKSDTVEVRVIAQQFAWNIHYAGADGKFGESRTELVDEEINPIGLDRNSPYGADDIVTMNQLHIPKDKTVKIKLSSMDVIHSFALPEMRVKQDAIPGMEVDIFFKAKYSSNEYFNYLWT